MMSLTRNRAALAEGSADRLNRDGAPTALSFLGTTSAPSRGPRATPPAGGALDTPPAELPAVDSVTLDGATRLLEASDTIAYVRDESGRIAWANGRARALFGVDGARASESSLNDHGAEFVRVSTLSFDRDAVSEEEVFDGSTVRYLRAERQWFASAGGDICLYLATDVTDLRLANLRDQQIAALMERAQDPRAFDDALRGAARFVELHAPGSKCCIWMRGSTRGWVHHTASDWPSHLAERAFSARSGRPIERDPLLAAQSRALFDGPLADRGVGSVYGADAAVAGWRGLLALPVELQGQVAATIDVLTPEPLGPSDAARRVCEAAARVVATAARSRAMVAHARRSAETCEVTGLLSRRGLEAVLEQFFQARGTLDGALLIVEIDRFAQTASVRGPEFGDALQRELAARVEAAARNGVDYAARLGEGQFALFLRDCAGASGATRVAQQVARRANDLMTIQTVELAVRVSIGVALAPADGPTASALMQRATAAVGQAREQPGTAAFRFFDSGMQQAVLTRLELEQELRTALGQARIQMHVQPQYRLDTGALVGFESLARWTHQTRGSIPPDHFIKLAEECGLIRDIGVWMMREAGRFAADWYAQRRIWVPVSVNVSALELAAPDFVSQVAETVRLFKLPAGTLEVELTESTALVDVELSIERLRALRALGVTVAIDDFGVGHANLLQLGRVPADRLKIDKSFVHAIDRAVPDTRILECIILLAKSLSLEIVAEGVETEAQRSFLAARRCEVAQGWGFSSAMDPNEALSLPMSGRFTPILRATPAV